MPEIVWKGSAQDDFLEIVSWLEEIEDGRGEQFARLVDRQLILLRQFPRIARVWMPPVRRLLISQTEYALYYTVEDRGIIVQALVHLRQSQEAITQTIRRRAPID